MGATSFAGPKERSFRPIVPIKKKVRTGGETAVSQSLSVKIPPPPIPKPENSLFPEDSVPEIDIAPDTGWMGPASTENSAEQETEAETIELGSDVEQDRNTEKEKPEGPTLSQLRAEAHRVADMGLKYKFGADDPKTGGLDCSGAMQYVLTNIGIKGVPRTSYDQYDWLKKKKLLDDVYGKGSANKMFKKLSPGDLIFWGGTWKSGHRVSHVMLYMGYNPTEDKHYVFGARSKSSEGLLGHGVDIFELDPDRGRLIAHGKIPGLVY